MSRRLALLALAPALLAIPASASAATPPVVTGPSATSLNASQPDFTWASGPAGEYVNSISVSTSNAVAANGDLASTSGGTYLSPLVGLTTKTTDRKLAAGVYYFNAGWRTADGVNPYEYGFTPVQTFTIPSQLTTLRGTYRQYSSIPDFNTQGSFFTNVKKVVVTCTVRKGFARISTQKRVMDYMTIGARNNFYCTSLRVPERYDGQRLNVVVQIVGGGKRIVSITNFRAL